MLRRFPLVRTDFVRSFTLRTMDSYHVDPLIRYIQDQDEHHRQESFQDEFRRLCKKYGVELDERYAWD